MTEYTIRTTWQGKEIPADEQVRWRLSSRANDLLVETDAPFYSNPAPTALPGPIDRLWEFEVVEIFFLGDDDRYLEVELGPFGHYLVLLLNGRRRIEQSLLPIEYSAAVSSNRWQGRAVIPKSYLPKGLSRFNAYAMFERDDVRRHLALFPLGGEKPDFHRLEEFQKFSVDVTR
jgi:hypothetical protein